MRRGLGPRVERLSQGAASWAELGVAEEACHPAFQGTRVRWSNLEMCDVCHAHGWPGLTNEWETT